MTGKTCNEVSCELDEVMVNDFCGLEDEECPFV